MTETNGAEAKYRQLFDTLIEGFCTIEVIFDAHGKPVDYRFLEINPAFERQTGLHNAQGKLMRELAPNHEQHWFEIYGKIALTGEPLRFENEAKALGRFYEVCAYRVGGDGEPQGRHPVQRHHRPQELPKSSSVRRYERMTPAAPDHARRRRTPGHAEHLPGRDPHARRPDARRFRLHLPVRQGGQRRDDRERGAAQRRARDGAGAHRTVST